MKIMNKGLQVAVAIQIVIRPVQTDNSHLRVHILSATP